MAEVEWIKIATGIFNDEKIMLIETMPNADCLIVIWFKLLCLAGRINNHGVFVMNETIPYTDEMFAKVFRKDVKKVKAALKTFEDYGMIEVINGVVTIPNWGKYQNLDKLEKRKEYQREYMKEYRDKQRQSAECKPNCKPNSKVYSKPNSKHDSNVNGKVYVSSLDIDKDKEEIDKEDKEEYREENIIDAKASLSSKDDIQWFMDMWNTLDGVGNIKAIKKIAARTQRCESVKARLKNYSLNDISEAIENIRNSDFLQGNNKKGWVITFDWFIKPNNFIKVLEGNYNDKNGHSERVNQVDSWI